MGYETILFETAGGAARITLNRPDRLNSFTTAMHGELRDALERVKSDDSVRVV
jgi:2-(1,2-epoxy-1,2-dihydrophenyl)acetyl-CoA isomerase